MMARILAVAQNTFREAVRDKVLYILIVFALAMQKSSIDPLVRKSRVSATCGSLLRYP